MSSTEFGESMISEIPQNPAKGQFVRRPQATPAAKERPAVRYRDHLDPKEHWLRGPLNRALQLLARISPGAGTLRVWLHRARGVKIGKGVWIGYDVILDSSGPGLIVIEDGVSISMRAMIIAHFKEFHGVKIERDAFVGPGAIILPNVRVGEGAVIKAGSVVSQSIPPRTIVEGNPAVPVARCEIPLLPDISMREFVKGLKPIGSRKPDLERRSASSAKNIQEKD
jgi:acetyltransferase-like isoleucine patch superfamily enzyme